MIFKIHVARPIRMIYILNNLMIHVLMWGTFEFVFFLLHGPANGVHNFYNVSIMM